MNMKLNVAVAAALVAAASSAHAGITIPAGDWTLDIGGVVNAYYTQTSYSGDAFGTAPLGLGNGKSGSVSNITTGLLPNYLSVSGKTRQNDLDVGFTISINPGSSTTNALDQTAHQENRQAFLTFGDASWGSVKLGKDLGVFASDAILNDMTLLGVGGGAGNLAGNTTTLGRIGSGYIYADWKSQAAYTSPNWNGFQFTAAVTQAFNAVSADTALGGVYTNAATGNTLVASSASTSRGGAQPAFEAKASYEWTGDVAGKVWASGISQKVDQLAFGGVNLGAERAIGLDVGTTVKISDFALTGYYYDGRGIGQTGQLWDGFDAAGKRRDSKGGYVQGTYTIAGPGTKLGLSWGQSKLEGNNGDTFNDLKNQMWTAGAYHPLTKHLNLVAEYSETKQKLNGTADGSFDAKAKTVSLGAILFF